MPVGDHHMQGQVPFARKRKSRWKPGTCTYCDMPPEDLLPFNMLLADPKSWPGAVFEKIDVPKGILPPRMRLWGATRVGQEWLEAHNYKVSLVTLRMHINRHVKWMAEDLTSAAAQAQLAEADHRRDITPVAMNPVRFKEYYEKSIELGAKAIGLLSAKVDEAIANKIPLSDDLLLKLAEQGNRMAASAATLQLKGMELNRDKEAEIDGFRTGGADPVPIRASKHHAIHVIDGEARPVVDEGRGDRRDYNEKAREQGSVELPA